MQMRSPDRTHETGHRSIEPPAPPRGTAADRIREVLLRKNAPSACLVQEHDLEPTLLDLASSCMRCIVWSRSRAVSTLLGSPGSVELAPWALKTGHRRILLRSETPACRDDMDPDRDGRRDMCSSSTPRCTLGDVLILLLDGTDLADQGASARKICADQREANGSSPMCPPQGKVRVERRLVCVWTRPGHRARGSEALTRDLLGLEPGVPLENSVVDAVNADAEYERATWAPQTVRVHHLPCSPAERLMSLGPRATPAKARTAGTAKLEAMTWDAFERKRKYLASPGAGAEEEEERMITMTPGELRAATPELSQRFTDLDNILAGTEAWASCVVCKEGARELPVGCWHVIHLECARMWANSSSKAGSDRFGPRYSCCMCKMDHSLSNIVRLVPERVLGRAEHGGAVALAGGSPRVLDRDGTLKTLGAKVALTQALVERGLQPLVVTDDATQRDTLAQLFERKMIRVNRIDLSEDASAPISDASVSITDVATVVSCLETARPLGTFAHVVLMNQLDESAARALAGLGPKRRNGGKDESRTLEVALASRRTGQIPAVFGPAYRNLALLCRPSEKNRMSDESGEWNSGFGTEPRPRQGSLTGQRELHILALQGEDCSSANEHRTDFITAAGGSPKKVKVTRVAAAPFS